VCKLCERFGRHRTHSVLTCSAVISAERDAYPDLVKRLAQLALRMENATKSLTAAAQHVADDHKVVAQAIATTRDQISVPVEQAFEGWCAQMDQTAQVCCDTVDMCLIAESSCLTCIY